MASCGNNDDPKDPPKILRLRKSQSAYERLAPDTEENVLDQTEELFRNFMYQRYQQETDDPEGNSTPALPSMINFTADPVSPASRVGRQLAMIGDDINVRYSEHFKDMIKTLEITPDTAYDAFASIARRLFSDGIINWGRILTLLSFGYSIAVEVLVRRIPGFIKKLVGFLLRFIVSENISKWVADQGGWIAALRYVPDTVGWPTIAFISSLAVASICAAYWLSKR